MAMKVWQAVKSYHEKVKFSWPHEEKAVFSHENHGFGAMKIWKIHGHEKGYIV